MISDSQTGKANAIPGQIKSIVIDGQLSVAYAGAFERALDCIRSISRLSSHDRNEQNVLEALIDKSSDATTEFLVISHRRGASLKKVFEGKVSEDLNEAWIGDSAALRALRNTSSAKRSGPPIPGFVSEEESAFTSSFLQAFSDQGTALTPHVGGVPIFMLGSPYGHCYTSVAATSAWDIIDLRVGSTAKQVADRLTGKTEWKFTGISSRWRGTAIYGTYFEQLEMGFIYEPLESDSAKQYQSISLSAFSKLLDNRAGRTSHAFLDKT